MTRRSSTPLTCSIPEDDVRIVAEPGAVMTREGANEITVDEAADQLRAAGEEEAADRQVAADRNQRGMKAYVRYRAEGGLPVFNPNLAPGIVAPPTVNDMSVQLSPMGYARWYLHQLNDALNKHRSLTPSQLLEGPIAELSKQWARYTSKTLTSRQLTYEVQQQALQAALTAFEAGLSQTHRKRLSNLQEGFLAPLHEVLAAQMTEAVPAALATPSVSVDRNFVAGWQRAALEDVTRLKTLLELDPVARQKSMLLLSAQAGFLAGRGRRPARERYHKPGIGWEHDTRPDGTYGPVGMRVLMAIAEDQGRALGQGKAVEDSGDLWPGFHYSPETLIWIKEQLQEVGIALTGEPIPDAGYISGQGLEDMLVAAADENVPGQEERPEPSAYKKVDDEETPDLTGEDLELTDQDLTDQEDEELTTGQMRENEIRDFSAFVARYAEPEPMPAVSPAQLQQALEHIGYAPRKAKRVAQALARTRSRRIDTTLALSDQRMDPTLYGRAWRDTRSVDTLIAEMGGDAKTVEDAVADLVDYHVVEGAMAGAVEKLNVASDWKRYYRQWQRRTTADMPTDVTEEGRLWNELGNLLVQNVGPTLTEAPALSEVLDEQADTIIKTRVAKDERGQFSWGGRRFDRLGKLFDNIFTISRVSPFGASVQRSLLFERQLGADSGRPRFRNARWDQAIERGSNVLALGLYAPQADTTGADGSSGETLARQRTWLYGRREQDMGLVPVEEAPKNPSLFRARFDSFIKQTNEGMQLPLDLDDSFMADRLASENIPAFIERLGFPELGSETHAALHEALSSPLAAVLRGGKREDPSSPDLVVLPKSSDTELEKNLVKVLTAAAKVSKVPVLNVDPGSTGNADSLRDRMMDQLMGGTPQSLKPGSVEQTIERGGLDIKDAAQTSTAARTFMESRRGFRAYTGAGTGLDAARLDILDEFYSLGSQPNTLAAENEGISVEASEALYFAMRNLEAFIATGSESFLDPTNREGVEQVLSQLAGAMEQNGVAETETGQAVTAFLAAAAQALPATRADTARVEQVKEAREDALRAAATQNIESKTPEVPEVSDEQVQETADNLATDKVANLLHYLRTGETLTPIDGIEVVPAYYTGKGLDLSDVEAVLDPTGLAQLPDDAVSEEGIAPRHRCHALWLHRQHRSPHRAWRLSSQRRDRQAPERCGGSA